MARFNLDGLDFSLFLARVLLYSRKTSFYPTTINKSKKPRGEFHVSTKITATFVISCVIFPLLQALWSPRLNLHISLWQ